MTGNLEHFGASLLISPDQHLVRFTPACSAYTRPHIIIIIIVIKPRCKDYT